MRLLFSLLGLLGITACGGNTTQASPGAGNVETLATKGPFVADLAVHGENLYWDTHDETLARDVLMTLPVAGGEAKKIASTNGSGPVAFDATNAYWLTWAGISVDTPDGALKKVPLDGTSATTLGLALNSAAVFAFAVTDTGIYWGGVKVPKEGGGPERVPNASGCESWVFADDTNLYCSTDNAFAFEKVPLDGSPATELVRVDPDPVALIMDAVIDASYAYLRTTACQLLKVPLAGGPAVTLVTGSTDPCLVGRMVVDASGVYWALSANPGALLKLPLNGGAVSTLASGLENPYYLVADETNLYWTGAPGPLSAIQKMRKPK